MDRLLADSGASQDAPITPGRPGDTWASGSAYEPYVGRWSRLVAQEFLGWLDLPAGLNWLDIGCGTGALSQAILQIAAPAGLHGLDRSTAYIAYAKEHVKDGRLGFELGDAQALPARSGSYEAAVSGFALNFVPQAEQAAREMRRVLKPGGTAACYVWDYAGKMQLMRHFWNAAAALDPGALGLDEGRRFSVCQPTPLLELFRQAGLIDVEVRAIEISTDFKDFEDYWSPFLSGQGPAPSYAMSLSEEKRSALRERIRAGLPFALDGSVPLVARAWAIRGVRS